MVADGTLTFDPKTRHAGMFMQVTGELEIVEFHPGSNPPIMVIKEKGLHYWAGQNVERAYGRAEYHVVEVVGPFEERFFDRGGISVKVRRVISIPIRLKQDHLLEVSARLELTAAKAAMPDNLEEKHRCH